jgi:hypothetical protein
MISTATLDAAVADVPPKPRIMRDGVRRWIPAAVPQMDDGSPVSEQFIRDLAANLNSEAVSIPIDGGLPGSVAHETAADRAVGWAHRAAVVDGHLFLEAEVLPAVAQAIEDGTLAYSSIDADYEVDAESGEYVAGSAHLITHALTNTPKIRGMLPMQAVATVSRRRVCRGYTRARLAQEKDMEEETPNDGEGMTLEQALARIAELEQQLEEVRAKLAAAEAAAEEMSARLAESEDEEKLEAKREAACARVVDAAIAEGRIAPSSRERWLAVARGSLEAAQTALASIPARTRRVVQPGESPERVDARAEMVMDEAEAHLAMQLRAGGMSEEKIKQKIAARRVRKVV